MKFGIEVQWANIKIKLLNYFSICFMTKCKNKMFFLMFENE